MKTLEQRRDELADKVVSKISDDFYAYDDGHLYELFRAGFDAAVAELMPEIEKLVEALEFYSKHHHHIYTTAPNFANEALTNVRKPPGDE